MIYVLYMVGIIRNQGLNTKTTFKYFKYPKEITGSRRCASPYLNIYVCMYVFQCNKIFHIM